MSKETKNQNNILIGKPEIQVQFSHRSVRTIMAGLSSSQRVIIDGPTEYILEQIKEKPPRETIHTVLLDGKDLGIQDGVGYSEICRAIDKSNQLDFVPQLTAAEMMLAGNCPFDDQRKIYFMSRPVKEKYKMMAIFYSSMDDFLPILKIGAVNTGELYPHFWKVDDLFLCKVT